MYFGHGWHLGYGQGALSAEHAQAWRWGPVFPELYHAVKILLMHGFSFIPFELSVAVLTTLIGSTTASVLGLFAIVANYLFPKR